MCQKKLKLEKIGLKIVDLKRDQKFKNGTKFFKIVEKCQEN